MKQLVYVAGPLFSDCERNFLKTIVTTLSESSNLNAEEDFFLPQRDGLELGKGPNRHDIFRLDITKVKDAKIVVALLDGQDVDSGTSVEIGFAYANNKKIFGIITDFRASFTNGLEPHRPNLMVWGACEEGRTLFYGLNELSLAFSEFVSKNRLK
jgi:nucleoside 2-deoxyribosyltransferase